MVLQERLTALDRYRLRCIMTGGINTLWHLHRTRVLDSPICQCCGQAPETWVHLFAECPAHAHIRDRDFTQRQLDGLPECLRLHGLCPETLRFGDDRDRDRSHLLGLVGTVQYMLLDALANRNALMGEPLPRPRWARA